MGFWRRCFLFNCVPPFSAALLINLSFHSEGVLLLCVGALSLCVWCMCTCVRLCVRMSIAGVRWRCVLLRLSVCSVYTGDVLGSAVFYLHRRAGVNVQYPSLLYSLYNHHHSFCASILIKGMRGTACDKEISIVPILSSFIRLQHTHKHTEKQPTLSHGNSQLFYEVANSYELIRCYLYVLVRFDSCQ